MGGRRPRPKGVRVSGRPNTLTQGVARPTPVSKGLVDYARLLKDPCNGPLVHPAYGTHSQGYITRFKFTVAPAISSVSGNTCFIHQVTPSNFYTQLTQGLPTFICEHAATTTSATGTVGGIRGPVVLPGVSNISDTVRPIAGCVRIVYTGSEFDRRGEFGAYAAVGGPPIAYGQTGVSVDPFWSQCQMTKRAGEPFEMKWVPSAQDTVQSSSADAFNINSSALGGSSMVVMGRNLDTSSATAPFYLEYTIVYEWQPLTGAGYVCPPPQPAAGTLNQALGLLGPIGSWLFTHSNLSNVSTFVDKASKVYGAVKYGAMALL